MVFEHQYYYTQIFRKSGEAALRIAKVCEIGKFTIPDVDKRDLSLAFDLYIPEHVPPKDAILAKYEDKIFSYKSNLYRLVGERNDKREFKPAAAEDLNADYDIELIKRGGLIYIDEDGPGYKGGAVDENSILLENDCKQRFEVIQEQINKVYICSDGLIFGRSMEPVYEVKRYSNTPYLRIGYVSPGESLERDELFGSTQGDDAQTLLKFARKYERPGSLRLEDPQIRVINEKYAQARQLPVVQVPVALRLTLKGSADNVSEDEVIRSLKCATDKISGYSIEVVDIGSPELVYSTSADRIKKYLEEEE